MEISNGLKELLENLVSKRNSTNFLSRSYVLGRDEKGSISFPQSASLNVVEKRESSKQVPRWEDLDKDILAFIFNKLDVIDLTMGASRVCISWFLASHNKTLWNTVDLSKLQQACDSHPYRPVVFYKHPVDYEGLNLRNLLFLIFLFFVGLTEEDEDNTSLEYLVTILKEGNISLNNLLSMITKLSGTVPKKLIFSFSSSIQEKDLISAAERMPNIEKLVLPVWCYQTKSSFWYAFNQWKNLKMLIVARDIYSSRDISLTGAFDFQTVGENCSTSQT